MTRRFLRLAALTLVAVLVATACAGGDDGGGETEGDTAQGEPQRGGILRLEREEFGYTGNFDPTGEYLGQALGYMSNMLSRTLMGYPHLPGNEGNELVPDLAEAEPEISDDQLTYTFTIKDGVEFGPPVDREITSDDIRFAFERIGTPSVVAQYGFYYDVIEGMAEFKEGKAKEISGIETPDDKTISFTLTEPTGDFPYRVSMPATAPIPREVGKCFNKAGDYGRYLISSGPYMTEGSEELDISSCKTMEPISGYDPTARHSFVRNPNYDQATDDTRDNFIDGLEVTLNTNTNDLEQKVIANESDLVYTPTPPTLRKFVTQQDLRDRLHINGGDRTWYITLNLTQPPFDDIHVRKAANLVMDKDGLQRAWGGPTQGEVATHIVPDIMLGGALDDYDPYPSEGNTGDVEAAKEEMSQSKYDTNGDGSCEESPECQNVLDLGSNTPPNTDMAPIIEESLGKIGITLDIREVTDAYTPIQTVARHIPISHRPGWGKDYPDPSTFMVLFHSESILPTGNVNYSLVGLTPEQAEKVGAEGTIQGIPSVDQDIDECGGLTGQERMDCYVELDQKIMEEVVPWVPYLDATTVYASSDAVTHYVFDQFAAEPAWSRIAIDPSLQE